MRVCLRFGSKFCLSLEEIKRSASNSTTTIISDLPFAEVYISDSLYTSN
uniref:Uncharacterized protein n=1 Tax=Anguilla anguilla TaxID=7936 RepID=A0A0E9TWH0_ANGAN